MENPPCGCGDGARWEEYDDPTYWNHNGKLAKVTFYYVCMSCEVTWHENHLIADTDVYYCIS